MRIVLLGAPGSGKGTQGHRLAAHYKIPEISTGDLLREAVAEGSPLGRAAKAVMDAGQLVSDEIVLGVIRERLGKPDAQKGFILDGFPRNEAQAEQLDELLDELRQPIELALMIQVDVDMILQRLLGRRTCRSCGASFNIFSAPPHIDDSCDECGGRLKRRSDDNEETIGNRLRIYEMQTMPVVERYREQKRLRVVQGIGEISTVFASVKKAVDEARVSFSGDRSAAIRQAVARKQAASKKAATDAARAVTAAAASARKKLNATRDAVIKKKTVAKKAASEQKVVVTKKTAAKKKVAAKKATSKKTTVKKKAVVKKKAPVKKKVPSKKKVAKKSVVKKKAAKKKAPLKKKVVSKKKVAKKKVVARSAARKKPAAKKNAVAKKKSAKKRK